MAKKQVVISFKTKPIIFNIDPREMCEELFKNAKQKTKKRKAD